MLFAKTCKLHRLRRNIVALCTSWVLALPIPLWGQQLYFANYSVDDGLPHSQVNHIIQAKDGYLWVATNMGLSRFDGHEFRNYSSKDGLGDNKVRVIFEPSAGNLLIGHENGTLSWWTGTHFEVFQLDKASGRILCIFQDRDKNLWIGTEHTGVFMLAAKDLLANLRQKKFKHYAHKEGLSRDVLGLAQDKNGNYLFITDLGLKQLDSKSGIFSFFKPKGLDVVQFSAVLFDKHNTLWLGTVKEGLYSYNTEKEYFVRHDTLSGYLKSNFVTSLTLDKKGAILAGTWGGGLSVVADNQATILTEDKGLGENKIRCAMVDDEGNIWAGTNQNGLSCYRGDRFEVFFKSRGGPNTQVGAVFGDSKGRMWFGANNHIMLIKQAGAIPEKIDLGFAGKETEVTSIIEDQKGTIWIATWGRGVFLLNTSTLELTRFTGRIPASSDISFNENFIYALYKDKTGRIWFSMLQGLAVYHPAQNSIKTYTKIDGLPGNSITDIQEDHLRRLWIGTADKGLSIFDNGHFTSINPPDIRINPAISSLALDKANKMWIATEGGGLYCFDGKQYANYSTEQGLPSNYISFVETDLNGKIWLGTHKGICRFDPLAKTNINFDKTDKHARIEAKPNAVFLDPTGYIWAGTINGALKINTNKVIQNTKESVTYITTVKVFQDTLSRTGLELNYRRNYLSFYFMGICYSDPDKVMYQYKLEGTDKEWQKVTQNFVNYNNLNPGSYVFMVRSCNNDGLWNRYPTTFSFKITPPFWMTWWFYTGSGLLCLLVIYSIVKFRERNLRLEKKHLELMVLSRTQEIVRQKEEIETQRDELQESSTIIEQKNQAITDSIRYAQRIQLATLPYYDVIYKNLTDTLILYKPKDIVSGDFYAYAKKDTKHIFAVADCTGHGVPGAFMSMIGTNLFNQIINEKGITQPAEILRHLDIGIERALKQDESENHDGMDMIICSLDFTNKQFEYAGANRPLWIMHQQPTNTLYPQGPGLRAELYGEYMCMIKPDKVPIGGFLRLSESSFTNHLFIFQPGDAIYLFTDGFADQFGGEHGRKLLSKRFRDYLISIRDKPVKVQEDLLNLYFENWKQNREQVDDVLVVGIWHHGNAT